MTYILYHKNCLDGFAAYFAWQYFHPTTEHVAIPVQYGEPVPEIPDGSDVLLLDFSYSSGVLAALASRSQSLAVIDHHATAERELSRFSAPNAWTLFSPDQSACLATWHHYSNGLSSPQLLHRIQDYDLWQGQYPDTMAVCSYLRTIEWTYRYWMPLCALPISQLAEKGAPILAYKRQRVEAHATAAICLNLPPGIRVPAVNAPSDLRNEVCARLLERFPDYPAAIVFWQDSTTGQWIYSIRSRACGPWIDCAILAESLGGGGHGTAASFRRFMPPLHRSIQEPMRAQWDDALFFTPFPKCNTSTSHCPCS